MDGSGPAQRDGISLGGPTPSSASVYSLDGSGPAQREGISLGDAPASNAGGGLQLDMPAPKIAVGNNSSRDSGYSLEGRSDAPFASVDIHGGRPGFDGGRRGTGAGTVVLFIVVGAAAAFGILTALQGPPW